LEAGFVPQTYRPGAEAEVDFHDLWVVLAGISAALSVGSANADVVALEARKAAEHRAGAHAGRNGSGDGAEVLVLAQHRLGVAILDERPLPSVAQYDTLLNVQSS
jgi:hypothetical protein